jgi:hypothetical protein
MRFIPPVKAKKMSKNAMFFVALALKAVYNQKVKPPKPAVGVAEKNCNKKSVGVSF